MNNLNIKINNANQYIRNAEGKDAVYIEGISLEDIDSYKIKNNNLIISLKQGKTITLFNIDDIRYLKTTETSGETLTLMNTLVDNKSNIMDSPTSGNQYLGTFYADAITAFDASEVIQAVRYKKGKKWKTRYIHTGMGALINAGDGDDSIIGSKYDDIITAGAGQNAIAFASGDRGTFGNDTIHLTGSEALDIKLTGSSTGEIKTPYYMSGQNLVITVMDGDITRGTITIANFGQLNLSLCGDLKIFGTDGQTPVLDLKNITSNSFKYGEGSNFNYDGTRLNEIVDASEAGDIITYVTKKAKTRQEVLKYKSLKYKVEQHTGIGVTIDTGAGNDIITGSKYNDVIIGGGNSVDAGGGDDYVSYGKSYTVNTSNAENVCAEWSHETNAPDGKIGAYRQGEGPICSTLAFLESLTRYNKLSDYVTIKNYSGSYTVTFNNFHEDGKTNSVTVNSSDLNDYKDVTGDLDVVLTCLGLKKLLRIYGVYSINYETQDSFTNVPKYFFGNNDMTIITGKNKINKLWELYSNKQITNFTIGIFESSMHLSPNYDLGIITGHAYSVYDMQDDYIALVNPWDNKDILKIDYDTLYSYDVYGYAHGYDSEIVGGSSLVYMPYGGEDMADAGELQYDVASWLAGADSLGAVAIQDDKSASVAELVASYVPNDSNLKEFV